MKIKKYYKIIFASIILLGIVVLFVFFHNKTKQKKRNIYKLSIDKVYYLCNKQDSKQLCFNILDSLYLVSKTENFKYLSKTEINLAKAYTYSRQLEPNNAILVLNNILKMNDINNNYLSKIYRLLFNEYYHGIQDKQKGLEYALKAISLNVDGNNKISNYNLLMYIFVQINNYKMFKYYYNLIEKELSNKHKISDKKILMYAKVMEFDFFLKEKKYRKALNKNIDFLNFLDNNLSKKDEEVLIKYGETYLQLSNIYIDLNIPDSAKYFYQKGNNILKMYFTNVKSLYIYSMRHNYLMYSQQYEQAKIENNNFEKTLNNKNDVNFMTLMEYKAQVCSVQNEFKKAMYYLQKADDIKFRIYKKTKKNDILSRYYLEQYNLQKQVFLETENTIYVLQIFFVTSGILILFLILIWIYRKKSLNKKLKLNKSLQLLSNQEKKLHKQLNYAKELYEQQQQKAEEHRHKQLFDKFETFINKNKLYLNINFKIEHILEILDTNKKYIYYAVKNQTGMSMGNYINYLRIMYAKENFLIEPNGMKFKEIALKSGFKCEKTFKRNLKKILDSYPKLFQSNKQEKFLKIIEKKEDIYEEGLEKINKKNRHKKLFEKFEKLINEDKLFLNVDLKSKYIFQKMGVNRKYISDAIKNQTGMTMSNYINYLRVMYAKNLMKSEPNLKLKTVALKSGFSCERTLQRNIKKY